MQNKESSYPNDKLICQNTLFLIISKPWFVPRIFSNTESIRAHFISLHKHAALPTDPFRSSLINVEDDHLVVDDEKRSFSKSWDSVQLENALPFQILFLG